MPKPLPTEKQKDFVKRCIPVIMNESKAKNVKQAVAICSSMFEKKK
jgi:hypothetical protein